MKTLNVFLYFALCTILVSCASFARSPQRVELIIDVAASANPNARGRPSPVALNTMLLSSDRRFVAADYLALLRDPDAVLQKSLTDVRHIDPIAPGEMRRQFLEIDSNVRFIGIVAELVQFNNVRTRTVLPLDAALSDGLIHIAIDASGVHAVSARPIQKDTSRFNED